MKSKGYLRLYNRFQHFRADIELVDILLRNKENLAGTDKIFKETNPRNHPTIASYTNTPHNRDIALKHLRSTLYVSNVKEIYEEVTEYLRYVLVHSARHGANINRLVGPHKVNLDANFLLSAESHDVITRAVTDSIFQQLEGERSSLELIKKISNKLDLNIDDNTINDALPYLLMRHFFVHEDGKPTNEFKEKHPEIRIDIKKRIVLSSSLLLDARLKVLKLISEIDQGILAKNFFPPEEIQP